MRSISLGFLSAFVFVFLSAFVFVFVFVFVWGEIGVEGGIMEVSER